MPLSFDAELLSRYDKPGPRYTSYPPATQFTPTFAEGSLRRVAVESGSGPLSVYMHVPYCRSPCFYCGCNKVISRDARKGAHYLGVLQREIALAARLFSQRREIVQLHFGGGTPNFLRPAQLAELVDCLRDHFDFSAASGADFSIELDPRSVEAGDIEALARIGFNRASFGVQDFALEVQQAVNRIQSTEQTLAAIDSCRAQGFRSVNVDLIYGLPRQTLAGFGATLDTLLERRPNRFAIYGYAHLPRMFKAQQRIVASDLPDPALRLRLLELAIRELQAGGYVYIGMDHFALSDDELALAQRSGQLHRNFMGYTTHADCDLLGLGVSAISHIGNSYSQNARDLREWEASILAGHLPVVRGLELTADDRIRADVIQQLMCHGHIDIGAVERRYDIDFVSYFGDTLKRLSPLIGDDLVSVVGSYIGATSRGRMLLRVIAMCFDRHLQPEAALPLALPEMRA
jgi:oxygen-independent coproporphyrinogen III oxidase